MCETAHVVVDVDALRTTTVPFKCAECDEEIPTGGEYRHVEGTLDDGSPGRVLYRAHEECYIWAVQDTHLEPENDGCFRYGRVELLT